MASAADFRRLALALDGTVEKPHFDRKAFVRARTFATLAPDEKTANIRLAPDEQQLKCEIAPDAFAPLDNAWGAQGWTCARLDRLSTEELAGALEWAWRRAAPRPKTRKVTSAKR